jgi:hypothetical protein
MRHRRATAHQLEHVGVALLRHDRRTGGERVRQRHEREFLRVEQQQVGRQAPQVLHEQRALEQQLRLGLAARDLHCRDRLLRDGEAQFLARQFAIQRQAGRTVAGGRAQRAPGRAALGSFQAFDVVAQFGGESSRPQGHRAGHGLLHVRVARQRDSAVAARQVIERAGAGVRRFGQLVGRVQQVKTQRGQHLVVARAAEMHTPAGRADARREAFLERGLAVFVGEFDLPLAGRVFRGERVQAVANGGKVGIGQEPHGVEHLGVRDGGAHVVLHQALVEGVVVTRRVREHTCIEGRAFVPEPAHGWPYLPLCCSAGVSALTSATMSVPAPSLVNTSASRPSGDLYDITCTRRTPPRMASSIALAFGSMPSTIFFSSRSFLRPARSV